MLAFDFGVYGPFGARRERHNMLTTQRLGPDGTYTPVEMQGAVDVRDWEQGWKFATTGFIMTGEVDRGVADGYAQHFLAMTQTCSQAWWVCHQAEWEYRTEWCIEERRRQEAFFERSPDMSSYDPARPWNSVLLAGFSSLAGHKFWEDRLKEPARLWVNSPECSRNPSWVDRQMSLAGPAGPPPPGRWHVNEERDSFVPAGPSRKRKRGRGGGAGAAQRPPARAVTLVPAERSTGSGGGQSSKDASWAEWANEKTSDGRFKRMEDGSSLCFDWGRNQDGCATPCKHVPKFTHACELCCGSHRTINCPSHPGWQPPAKGKGKGKGKGKHF